MVSRANDDYSFLEIFRLLSGDIEVDPGPVNNN